ncbi:uncharacterized protein MYCFIDRAFT_179245 [Pseudocercospora fijiensis CIRAD86]|uniref:Uncharacterized protein n=1 Tax=Pseudocercospora fijiensis (strain CIRAD86) TaxID=383855 RepID=M3A039_PSEFD|nr:uncharacterized protein MYCFIDRAFT_179245 [Pseudocercospora fijiensis CIRAD86]EME77751.1 hypothetical protein MYCFIDRAFT_179245 [Pseudocercospora fijiensis CIRAD86]
MVDIKREKKPVPILQQSSAFGRVKKNRSAPPAAFVSNQKLLQVFHCDQGELDLLKFHLGKTYDSFHEVRSKDEIFEYVADIDSDFREMLDGQSEAKTKLWYTRATAQAEEGKGGMGWEVQARFWESGGERDCDPGRRLNTNLAPMPFGSLPFASRGPRCSSHGDWILSGIRSFSWNGFLNSARAEQVRISLGLQNGSIPDTTRFRSPENILNHSAVFEHDRSSTKQPLMAERLSNQNILPTQTCPNSAMATQGNANTNFPVHFDPGLDNIANWKPSTLAVSHNATIEQLLSQIKGLIISGFDNDGDDRFKVQNNGLTPFMGHLTQAYNKKNTTTQVSADTMWTIWFRVRFVFPLSNGESRTIQLEDGVWQRHPEVLDIVKNRNNISGLSTATIRVSLELEKCTQSRIATIQHDKNLNHVVYPVRQKVEYFRCGLVQNGAPQLDKYGLLEVPRDQAGSPVERKNVIIARYEESNEMALSDDFRLMGTWKFGSGTTWFRIGDPDDAGQGHTLGTFDSKTLLTQTFQVNGGNPPFNGLHATFASHKRGQHPREIPKLPPLTGNVFPRPQQLQDPQNQLPNGVSCTIIIRVVYLVTSFTFDHLERKSPRNINFSVTNNTTFEGLAFRLWKQYGGGGQDRIRAGLTLQNTRSNWWIMPDRTGRRNSSGLRMCLCMLSVTSAMATLRRCTLRMVHKTCEDMRDEECVAREVFRRMRFLTCLGRLMAWPSRLPMSRDGINFAWWKNAGTLSNASSASEIQGKLAVEFLLVVVDRDGVVDRRDFAGVTDRDDGATNVGSETASSTSSSCPGQRCTRSDFLKYDFPVRSSYQATSATVTCMLVGRARGDAELPRVYQLAYRPQPSPRYTHGQYPGAVPLGACIHNSQSTSSSAHITTAVTEDIKIHEGRSRSVHRANISDAVKARETSGIVHQKKTNFRMKLTLVSTTNDFVRSPENSRNQAQEPLPINAATIGMAVRCHPFQGALIAIPTDMTSYLSVYSKLEKPKPLSSQHTYWMIKILGGSGETLQDSSRRLSTGRKRAGNKQFGAGLGQCGLRDPNGVGSHEEQERERIYMASLVLQGYISSISFVVDCVLLTAWRHCNGLSWTLSVMLNKSVLQMSNLGRGVASFAKDLVEAIMGDEFIRANVAIVPYLFRINNNPFINYKRTEPSHVVQLPPYISRPTQHENETNHHATRIPFRQTPHNLSKQKQNASSNTHQATPKAASRAVFNAIPPKKKLLLETSTRLENNHNHTKSNLQPALTFSFKDLGASPLTKTCLYIFAGILGTMETYTYGLWGYNTWWKPKWK